MAKKKNISRVKKALDEATPVEPPKDEPAADGPPKDEAKSGFPMPKGGLPDDSPVVPLGVKGNHYFFLDALHQFRALAATDIRRQNILSLFSPKTAFLYDTWPRTVKSKKTGEQVRVGWESADVEEALINACSELGSFDPKDMLRGRGAWPAADGGLILHRGDKVLRRGADGAILSHDWGWLDGHIYPRGAALPKPHGDPQVHGDAGGPGGELLDLLGSWNFMRGTIDQVLLLGWICAAMLGGALHYRPGLFLVGDKATGKSTLQAMLKGLFGPALLQVENATAAYIYQTLGQDSLPVALDELEADAENAREKAVLDVARVAASGGQFGRGGASHQSTDFRALSCFLFSAINPPGMEDANLSRLAILNLRQLPQGARPPDITPLRMAALGVRLLRRLFDQWHRYEETRLAFLTALTDEGHTGRTGDTFGVLLACADLALRDGAPDRETLKMWAEWLAPKRLAELESIGANWRRCLEHLLTARIDIFRNNERKSVAQWLEYWLDDNQPGNPDDAHKALASIGLDVVRPRNIEGEWLAIANSDAALRTLFDGSKWYGRPGQKGVWVDAIRQMPRGTRDKPNWLVSQQRIGHVSRRCTMVRIEALKDLDLTAAAADEGEADEAA